MTKEHRQLARRLYEYLLDDTHKEAIMGDAWDYRLRKMDIAWELAKRVMPNNPNAQGAWTEGTYLKKAQETLTTAQEIVDAVFPTHET